VLTPLSIPAFWLYFSLLPAVGWLGVAKGISRQERTSVINRGPSYAADGAVSR